MENKQTKKHGGYCPWCGLDLAKPSGSMYACVHTEDGAWFGIKRPKKVTATFDSVVLREQIAEIIQERLQWCGVCNDFLDAEDQEDIKRRIKQGDTLTEQAVDRVFSLITGEADA